MFRTILLRGGLLRSSPPFLFDVTHHHNHHPHEAKIF